MRGVEGVLVLAERGGHHRVHAVEDSRPTSRPERRRAPFGSGGVAPPQLATGMAEGVVPARPGAGRRCPPPTNTISVPAPSGVADGVESIGTPVWAGQPGVPDPSARWKAHRLPARSPTTTEGPLPSRVATDGELWPMGEPASGSDCCQTSEADRAWAAADAGRGGAGGAATGRQAGEPGRAWLPPRHAQRAGDRWSHGYATPDTAVARSDPLPCRHSRLSARTLVCRPGGVAHGGRASRSGSAVARTRLLVSARTLGRLNRFLGRPVGIPRTGPRLSSVP